MRVLKCLLMVLIFVYYVECDYCIAFSPQIQTECKAEEQRFRGIIPTLMKIGREEGFRGYFKGNGTNVIRIVPYEAVKFAAYEEYKMVSSMCLQPCSK